MDQQRHLTNLFAAELQFRLASAVRLASTLNKQPLDVPTAWSHGRHLVEYEEIALRPDQADYAAFYLHQSATFLMTLAIRNALKVVDSNPKNSTDANIQAAYQISRLVRNAFAHSPFEPVWSIDEDCKDKLFIIPEVIELNTKGLDQIKLDWTHYGGPLALYKLCRFVRVELLKDKQSTKRELPAPETVIYQQGGLILIKVDKIPLEAVEIEPEILPDGSIHLGGGHLLKGSGNEPDS